MQPTKASSQITFYEFLALYQASSLGNAHLESIIQQYTPFIISINPKEVRSFLDLLNIYSQYEVDDAKSLINQSLPSRTPKTPHCVR